MYRRGRQSLFPSDIDHRHSGKRKQLLANIRAEDVAASVEYLSHLDEAVGEAYNISDNSNPTLEEALLLASEAFETNRRQCIFPWES